MVTLVDLAQLSRAKITIRRPDKAGLTHAVEVDGDFVRWCVIDNTRVIDYGTIHGSSTTDAVAQWRNAAHPSGDISIVWSGPGAQCRRMRVDRRITGDLLAPVLANKAAGELGATLSDHLVSAVALTPDGVGIDEPYVVASVDAASVAAIWAPLSGMDRVSVTTLPLIWSEDGLHLSIRWSSATLALVDSGYPVQFRYLDSGGLELLAHNLIDALNLTDESPAEVVARVALSNIMPTGEAGKVVQDYIDRLAFSIRQSANAWAKGGMPLPDSVYISGMGVRLPTEEVEHAIAAQSGLVARREGIAVALDRTSIPLDEDGASHIVVMTALAGAIPASAALLDRGLEGLKRARQRAAAKRRKIGAIVGAVLALVALGVAPILLADSGLSSANANLATANTTYQQLAPYVAASNELLAGQSAVTAASSGNVDWSVVVAKVIAASPPNATFSAINISGLTGTETITLVGSLAGTTSFAPVAGWISSLKALGFGVAVSSISSATSNNSSTGVSVALNLTGSTALMQSLAKPPGAK